jgi:hypothetical protein
VAVGFYHKIEVCLRQVCIKVKQKNQLPINLVDSQDISLRNDKGFVPAADPE